MSADLMTGIQTRWAATPALVALIPIAKFTTGQTDDATVPYCTISKTNQDTAMRSNGNDTVDDITVMFKVSDDDYDDAHAIIDQIKTSYYRADFALAGSDKVIDVMKGEEEEERDDDKIWRVSVEMIFKTYFATGV